MARIYSYGQTNRSMAPAPDNEWLAWGLHLAHLMGETRGWNPAVRGNTERALIVLLSEHADGDLIRVSDFYDVLADHSANIKRINEILTTMEVLVDDRPTTFQKWLRTRTARLPATIRSDVQAWATLLHEGGPRDLARNPQTVRTYLYAVEPALAQWSLSYVHLRQVTSKDVRTYLQAMHGRDLRLAQTGLRSMFRWAKRSKVIFLDPTSRIHASARTEILWQRLLPEEIQQTISAATTPQARLLVAFAAIHAARPGQIRALHLDDVDLPGHRLTIAGHERPLDDVTRGIVLAWLDHRREHWPDTANTHLLISQHSALGLAPVSGAWTNDILRGLPATLDRLRIDRQLEEAITGGADPLHLAAVFGLAEATAIRYANNAARLLVAPRTSTSTPLRHELPDSK